ncbi:efflux RND transporter permease subunit [Paraburkholderia dinghuensis]|uniref:RND family transporter n=1 Tax=Paraburkholderia dinghuensis TaxID=2305225 RepID=A0A3N6MMA2_9BURK|nr:MMPL family transporter [Paraburkholderia dinghuensis]RQH04964.1 RND family transporter [Paraburkholderia dinghuensis]
MDKPQADATGHGRKPVSEQQPFDRRSGGPVERLIFNHRALIVIVCVLLTALFGFRASRLEVNANFLNMIPQSHPFVRNYLDNEGSLRSLGNSLRISVETTKGSIYDPDYLRTLQKINDKVFLMHGVDRTWMKSLWTPSVRWTEVTEDGFKGGPVMPEGYDGSAKAMAELRRNVASAGLGGSMVANDERSSMIFVPLLDKDPATGLPLDYRQLSHDLQQQMNTLATPGIKVHIVGFAKLTGDLIDGLDRVIIYFGISTLIAALALYGYTRCVRSTLLVLLCSAAAVTWQLGIVQWLGFVLDPYSILVPFLVFAIGVSHGAQKMNGITRDIARGAHRYAAARFTFRRLFLAGLTALLADVVGFAVLMIIDVPVIRNLALAASIGVGVLIFTNLVLLPVLLSYTGVSASAIRRARNSDDQNARHSVVARGYMVFERFSTRRWAIGAMVGAAILFVGGYSVSRHLQVGDLDAGAPELKASSRYNRDNAFINQHYNLSSDVFAVIVKTPNGGIERYPTLIEMDRLETLLRGTPGVRGTESAASVVRQYIAGSFEGSPKWLTINRDPFVTGDAFAQVVVALPELTNADRTVAPLLVFLSDHKAETLARVVKVVQDFAAAHDTADHRFLLAAGSAGIEAATNIVVEQANREMLALVYASVAILCFITFRTWRAVVVALIPLMLTSVLCEALMVMLGIGVKVATLPVIALGVGIGVDYALYLLSVQLARQRAGATLREAYRDALQFTGKVVMLVGFTLAGGVVTWVWSPIKFQADMGILLTFMFLWNMVGALVLIPALSYFLLRPKAERQRGEAQSAPAGQVEQPDAGAVARMPQVCATPGH